MFQFAPQLFRQLNQTLRSRLAGDDPVVFDRPLSKSKKPFLTRVEDDHPKLQQAIKSATEHLLGLQTEGGFWEAPVYDNSTITCEYLMFLRFLGIADPVLLEKAKKTLLDTQLEDGGWNIFGGGPSEHSATVEAYFALKLCGVSNTDLALKKAKELILKNGGIDTTRVFTKINLAMFGQYPWSKIPVINPELMLLPRRAPIHIYEFSSWSRAVIIPLLIIFDKKPVAKLRPEEEIPELYTKEKQKSIVPQNDIERVFVLAQKVLSIYEKSPVKPLRKIALDLAEKWIWNHQDEKGNWGGIFPAMANSIVALHLRGHLLSDPRLQKGLKMLRSFADVKEDSFRMQSTVSPVWDTGIALYALQESGTAYHTPKFERTVDWLLNLQILNVRGDWRYKAIPDTRPGGWPFEHENDHFPDIDDSALAILALLPHEQTPQFKQRVATSIDRGVEWILGMQGTDGGWGAFDRDNNKQILNQIPFADLKSLLDPSTPDVTGHVIEALGASGFDKKFTPIKRAIEFLRLEQKEDGSWFGRWGVNYVYGTAAVLSGLLHVGESMDLLYVKRAAAWLASVQNEDGGWGESCLSYDTNAYVPLGKSTASQTAWGLIGLLAASDGHDRSIERGIQYLLKNQNRDGDWTEEEWTGTGFPRHFYLRYDYYRIYFPLMALGRYATRLSKKSANT